MEVFFMDMSSIGKNIISSSSSSSTSYPTKCTPYIAKPSMCRLKMDEAQTVFSYSLQQMR